MGVVVDSLSGKPIPAAIVNIGASKVKADDEGRFVFADLAKGYYAIDASKAGYFDGSYGRSRPAGPAATLALGADERIGNVRIALFRWGAISGQVMDEASEPVAGAEVDVLARRWIGGRLTLVPIGSAVTDDRGFYRVVALGAGDFVVAAIYHTLPVVRGSGIFTYPVHYFGGGTSIEQATAVTLKVGDDRIGIDISLQLSPASRVFGIVKGPNGPLAAPVALTTSAETIGTGVDLQAAETTSEPDGGFLFRAVPTGTYAAKVIVRPQSVRTENAIARLMWASTPVIVNDSDVSGVEVVLRPGFRIAGRVVFESATRGRGPGFDVLRRLSASIDSQDVDTRSLGVTVAFDSLGGFSSSELPPGGYFMRIENTPPGWTLKQIAVRGRDISNAPIRLDADVSGLTFTFTERPTEVAGFVRSDAGIVEGSTVLVFPRDRASWVDFGRDPLGLRSARSSRDGSFRFLGLPPGDYFLIAVDDAASADWQEPKRLELLAQSAVRVTVADGEKLSLDLRPAAIR